MVAAKAHSLDIESFAKEQLEGKNVESILEQIKQKDSDERLKIEEKVWEARLQDASAKIEELEKENLDQREELTSKLEQELVSELHFYYRGRMTASEFLFEMCRNRRLSK